MLFLRNSGKRRENKRFLVDLRLPLTHDIKHSKSQKITKLFVFINLNLIYNELVVKQHTPQMEVISSGKGYHYINLTFVDFTSTEQKIMFAT